MDCLPYLEKGDSMKYISQFLDLIEEEKPSSANSEALTS